MPAAHPERLIRQCLALLPREAVARATDAELLGRFARDRDGDAFAALVARHGPLVLAVCRRLLRTGGAAEDVAQAAFLVLARKAGSVPRPDALAAWLHRTACHLALKQRRAEDRRRGREAAASRGVTARADHGPVDELAGRELLGAIDEEIGRMPERFRLPVVLCCLEGRTLEDAGKRLDWTPGSVKGRLERGRAELRARLVRRGFTLAATCAGLDVLCEGARAALPSGFGAATLKAAVAFASGAGAAGAGAGGAVAAIAEEGVRGSVLLTRRVVLSLILAAGLLGGGVAAVAPAGTPDPPKPKPRADAAPVLAEKRKPRADRHGDPLPDGAVARLGTVRWRNSGVVQAMAFTPDGKTLASGTRYGVRLFDAEGKLTREIRTPDSTFHSLAFSPDGTRLAGRCTIREQRGGLRDVVQVWDLGTTGEPKEYGVEGIRWAGWSAAGEPLALRQAKDAVVLSELASGRERRFEAANLRDRRLRSFGFAYAPAAKVLTFDDSRAALHVCDVSTGKKLCTLETKGGAIRSLALSPDGRSLASLTRDATGDKWTVEIREVPTGKVRHSIASDQRGLESVAFAPDGKTVATVGWGEIRFWDPSTGRERARTKGDHAFAANVAFSPDGKTLATTASLACSVRLWDVATAEPKPTPVGHATQARVTDFSPDGRVVVTAGDRSIIAWDAATGESSAVVRRGSARNAALSADGKSLISCWTGDRVIVADLASGRERHAFHLDAPDRKDRRQSGLGIRLSRDRRTLLAFSMDYARTVGEGLDDSQLMTAWDVETRKELFRRRVGEIDFGEAVSPDLRLLALAQGGDGPPGGLPVRVEDLRTGRLHLNLRRLAGQTRPVAFSPDGRLLATNTVVPPPKNGLGEWIFDMKVWEVATAREVLSLPSVMNVGVAFSPSGRVLAMTAPSGGVLFWDLPRGEELARIKGFDAGVRSLAFSPDGRRLVSGLTDSTLLVWGVPNLKPVNARRLDAAGIAQAWADLAGDPKEAFAARGSLADSPAEAVALLKNRLTPVRPADADELRRLIAGLDGDSFAAREQARKGLEEVGERAAGALRAALGGKPSPEARKRIEALLRTIDGPVPDRETLRAMRAVAVLEDVGTREAGAVLTTLAGGLPEARLTREAKAALGRRGVNAGSGR